MELFGISQTDANKIRVQSNGCPLRLPGIWMNVLRETNEARRRKNLADGCDGERCRNPRENRQGLLIPNLGSVGRINGAKNAELRCEETAWGAVLIVRSITSV